MTIVYADVSRRAIQASLEPLDFENPVLRLSPGNLLLQHMLVNDVTYIGCSDPFEQSEALENWYIECSDAKALDARTWLSITQMLYALAGEVSKGSRRRVCAIEKLMMADLTAQVGLPGGYVALEPGAAFDHMYNKKNGRAAAEKKPRSTFNHVNELATLYMKTHHFAGLHSTEKIIWIRYVSETLKAQTAMRHYQNNSQILPRNVSLRFFNVDDPGKIMPVFMGKVDGTGGINYGYHQMYIERFSTFQHSEEQRDIPCKDFVLKREDSAKHEAFLQLHSFYVEKGGLRRDAYRPDNSIEIIEASKAPIISLKGRGRG